MATVPAVFKVMTVSGYVMRASRCWRKIHTPKLGSAIRYSIRRENGLSPETYPEGFESEPTS
jgi:hypothetical protein